VKKLVGEFAEVTGQVKEKAGNIKVASAESIKRADIPKVKSTPSCSTCATTGPLATVFMSRSGTRWR